MKFNLIILAAVFCIQTVWSQNVLYSFGTYDSNNTYIENLNSYVYTSDSVIIQTGYIDNSRYVKKYFLLGDSSYTYFSSKNVKVIKRNLSSYKDREPKPQLEKIETKEKIKCLGFDCTKIKRSYSIMGNDLIEEELWITKELPYKKINKLKNETEIDGFVLSYTIGNNLVRLFQVDTLNTFPQLEDIKTNENDYKPFYIN